MDDEKLFSCVSAFSGNGNTRDTTVHSKEALENIPEVHDPMSMELCWEQRSWSRWSCFTRGETNAAAPEPEPWPEAHCCLETACANMQVPQGLDQDDWQFQTFLSGAARNSRAVEAEVVR